MAEQHIKVLQGLGMPQDQIDQLEKMTPEQLKEWKPDDYSASVVTAVKNKLLNDNDFLNAIPEDKIPAEIKKKIESGQYTRFQKEILETAQKQLGLEDKDLADLTEEDKKSIKKTVGKVAEKYLAKKGNVEGLKDMQKNVQDMQEKLEKKDSEWQDKLTKDLEAANGKVNAKMIKALTKVSLAQMDKVKLAVGPGYLTDPVLAKMNSLYTVVLTDNDELDIKQKGNANLDVLENNKKLSFDQALRKIVLDEKLGTEVKEEEEPASGKTKKKITVGGEGGNGEGGDVVEMPSYIKDKIDQNATLENKK